MGNNSFMAQTTSPNWYVTDVFHRISTPLVRHVSYKDAIQCYLPTRGMFLV